MGNLGYAVLLFLLASLAGVIAWQSKTPGIQVLAALVSLVFGVTGALVTWDWLAARVADNTAAIRDALAVTPASRLAEAISEMEPWQADMMRRHAVEISLIVNPDAYPSYVIHAPNADVPLDFAAEFIGLTVYPHLCPVRHWSDGSRERAWAMALTDLIVIHGWASPAVGNQSARLVVPVSVVQERLGL
jgi:hypothetical protein